MADPDYKKWAQQHSGEGNTGVLFAALYVGEQLERIANALERIVQEEYREPEQEEGPF